MLKLIVAVTALVATVSAFAHVGSHDAIRHSSEHLIFALALLPVAWLLLSRARRVLSKIRRK